LRSIKPLLVFVAHGTTSKICFNPRLLRAGSLKEDYRLETATLNKNPTNAGWVIFIGGVGCSASRPA